MQKFFVNLKIDLCVRGSEMKKEKKSIGEILWDLWCVVSVVGIWPRFIEPNLLSTTRLSIDIEKLPVGLQKLKILHFTDLHLNGGMYNFFLEKLKKRAISLDPDLIVFTGDFLCNAKLGDKERLADFFRNFPRARFGNYAVVGNHDYEKYAFINENGEYDASSGKNLDSTIFRGLSKLFSKTVIKKRFTEAVSKVGLNQELVEILKDSPFKLLHNETITVDINGSKLNISGLGEYMLNKADVKTTFKNYDRNFPGIVLVHNPDAVISLLEHPGELILSGHTHGGQVNLPFLRNKFILMENPLFKRGLVRIKNKWIYTNRGVGGTMNFRWFSVPEMLLAELNNGK